MKLKLAENIRKYRKERALTQEQLAEVLGVTTGAVYKWESRLSVPELDLIMQMADFLYWERDMRRTVRLSPFFLICVMLRKRM